MKPGSVAVGTTPPEVGCEKRQKTGFGANSRDSDKEPCFTGGTGSRHFLGTIECIGGKDDGANFTAVSDRETGDLRSMLNPGRFGSRVQPRVRCMVEGDQWMDEGFRGQSQRQSATPVKEEGKGTCESLYKKKGQSLKDALADRANVNFGLFSSWGASALATPNDDDPLVNSNKRGSGPCFICQWRGC
jgi:hypothetical protein